MIKIKCPDGKLIHRPPVGFYRPKWQRFYNWPRDEKGAPVEDYPGGPQGVEKIVSVPKDQYHARLIWRKDVTVVDEAPKAPEAPKKKRGGKE
jgi:hypothetical protein